MPTPSTLRLFAAVALLPLAACQCDEVLQTLAPKIQIGDPYDASFSVCQVDFVENCTYDFGEVGIGRPKLFSFAIKNPTRVTLNIESITIEGAPSFTLQGEMPTFIDTTEGSVVTVQYAPEVEAAEDARLIIISDAENLLPGSNVVIELIAAGKNLGGPIITVEPGQCDFGEVGVGQTGTCSLSIGNAGNMELSVTDVSFSADTASVFIPGVFPVPSFVGPGTSRTISLTGVPTSAALFTGTLLIASNDPARPLVEVPLVLQGAQSPTAIARVKSINGIANSASNPAVEPLDNVVISGDQSVDSSGVTGNIVSYQWTFVSKPSDSSVQLSDPNSMDTGFFFNNGSTVDGLDVAGTFEISLTVTDVNGTTSSNNAVVVLNAVPTEGLHIQLTWSASSNDMDLHLGRGSNPDWCAIDDCYYANCQPGGFFSSNKPDWDGGGYGPGPGDPTLDIDDLSGFGPENTNIQTALNGSYIVGVDAFSISQPTDVSVKIFVGGSLVANVENHMDPGGAKWLEVARVDVNGATTVVELNTLNSSWSCAD